MASRARKPRRPALAGKRISRTQNLNPNRKPSAPKKLSSTRAGQGPLKRTMSLRDMATRRKKMKAFAEKQKTMLASGRTEDMKALAKKQKDKIASLGRTKKTRPTPRGRPAAGNSGMKTMYNRTRTRSQNRR